MFVLQVSFEQAKFVAQVLFFSSLSSVFYVFISELSGDEIAMIRSEVAPELLTYPNYTTEFLDLTDDTAMPNESHETDDHAK